MKRSDRLFHLTQLLQDGAWHPAKELADICRVSERSIWRDMELLTNSGLPIEALRGLGYRLHPVTALPPMNLTERELEALRLGLIAVADEADTDLQSAARSLLEKLETALPGHGLAQKPRSGIGRAAFAAASAGFAHMPLLRRAIAARRVLRLTQETLGNDGAQPASEEVLIWPLRMDYLGGFWSLTCWCETHADFEVYQVHRIHALSETGARFSAEPGKRIEDYLARFVAGPHGN